MPRAINKNSSFYRKRILYPLHAYFIILFTLFREEGFNAYTDLTRKN